MHHIGPLIGSAFFAIVVPMYESTESLSFKPSLKLELALKKTQTELEQLAGDVDSCGEDERSWLHRWALISTVGASTRIENAVLTDAEIEWVDTTLSQDDYPSTFEAKKASILDKLSKDRERSVEEVVGCRDLLSLIYVQGSEMQPLSETIICGLHKELLRHYPSAERYAGRYKNSPNQVVSVNHDTGDTRTVLDPTPPGPQTEAAMQSLVQWYNALAGRHPWPLLVATELVFRFLAIHPFQDGNGRLGRALFLLALMQGKDLALSKIINVVSIDRQIERHRPLYYSTLQQASNGQYKNDPADYELEPLSWFFLKMIQHALDDISVLRQRYASIQRLSDSATRVLACFRLSPERRLTPAELIDATGLVRRTVQNALKALMSAGVIQRLGAGRGTRYQLIF
ncbi:Fic family protein [bacterium]|nr:Fic family protein [bacterium]